MSENPFDLKIRQQFLLDNDIEAVIVGKPNLSVLWSLNPIHPRLMVLEEDYQTAIALIKDFEKED
ncbi:MAG: DUF2007 domain-containing protein [Bdellovibrionales bacterium]